MSDHHSHHHTAGMPKAFSVSKITRHNERAISIFLDGSLPGTQPGQFVMAWLPEAGEKPYSVAGLDPIRLMVVDVGPFSHALNKLNEGDRLWLRGPLGHGFEIQPEQHSVIAGGGFGIAPLYFLAMELIKNRCKVQVVLGARSAGDIIMADEFSRAGIDLLVTTNDGSLGLQGLVTDGLKKVMAGQKVDMVYACGPSAMLTPVAQVCREARVPCQLSWEAMMRCGMGLCGSCELEEGSGEPAGWLVCLDGPVARHD